MKSNQLLLCALYLALPHSPALAQNADPALESYLAHIAAAEGALRHGEVRAMRRWLDAVPVEQRAFEWRWLSSEADNSVLVREPHGGKSVQAIEFAPGGERYATGGADGTIKIWSASTHELELEFEAHQGGVYCLTWSKDGARLASSGADKTAHIWNPMSGELLTTFSGHGAPVTTVRFAPDGLRMASSSYTRPVGGEVRLWDAESGAELAYLQDGYAPITTCHFSPDGKRISAASWDQNYRVFDLEQPEQPLVVPLGSEGTYRAAQASTLSPNGELVAVACKDSEIHLFEAWSGEAVRDFVGHTKWVDGVTFSPDGTWLASASTDGSVGLWNVATGERVARLLGHESGVRAIAFAPNGASLLSGSADGKLRTWDVQRAVRSTARLPLEVTPYFTAESPSGEVFAVCSHQGRLELFSTRDGSSLRVLRESSEWENWVEFTTDGKLLLSAGQEGVSIWNVESGELVRSMPEAIGTECARFSPDGTAVAATGRDRKARVWEVASGALRFELEFERYQHALAFSPDGEVLVFAGGTPATLNDAHTGEMLSTLEPQPGRLRCVDFHPAGELLVSGGEDGRLRIWRRSDGSELQNVKAHDQVIQGVAISSDGDRIATIGSDDRLRLWDTSSAELVLSLDRESVYNISWSPSADRLWVTPLLKHVYCLEVH